jgi:DNA-binding phage protein
MKTLSTQRLDSDQTTRVLDHLQRARLARRELNVRQLTVSEIAEQTGLHYTTVMRFLGVGGKVETRDPRTSTTLKILGLLGWKLVRS